MRDDIGNDGAVAAAAYDKIDGRLASDLDCFLPGLKSTRTARCDVLRRIVRIEILDINIDYRAERYERKKCEYRERRRGARDRYTSITKR